jgi:hypothetical protein
MLMRNNRFTWWVAGFVSLTNGYIYRGRLLETSLGSVGLLNAQYNR